MVTFRTIQSTEVLRFRWSSSVACCAWPSVRSLRRWLQHLSDMPLHRRLLDLPEVAEQTVDVRHEPPRLLAADLLQRISYAEADDLVRVGYGGEQLRKPSTVGQHDVDRLRSPAEGVGVAALEHVGERLGHTTSIACRTVAGAPQAELPLADPQRDGRSHLADHRLRPHPLRKRFPLRAL